MRKTRASRGHTGAHHKAAKPAGHKVHKAGHAPHKAAHHKAAHHKLSHAHHVAHRHH